MAKKPLSQAVLLAHRVFCFLAIGPFPSVFEVTLAVPITKQIAGKKEEWRKNEPRRRRWLQRADSPLTGAAFTHFIPLAKKTGAIVTGDLLPRRDGSNHFNAGDVLLTREELGG